MSLNQFAKFYFCFVFFTGFVSGIYATTYYSISGTNPNVTSNWNSNRDGSSGSSPTNFTSGDVFIIQGTALAPGGIAHSLSTSSGWTISGIGSKFCIETGASLTANHLLTLSSSVTWQIDANGKYIHNHTSESPQTTTFAGTESFDNDAILEFRAFPATDFVFIECYKACTNGFPAVIWNMNGSDATDYIWDSDGNTTFTIRGDLNILSTGTGKIVMIKNENDHFIINGDFTISSGIVNFHRDASSSNASLSVYGNMQLLNNSVFDFSPNGSASDITFNLRGNFINSSSGTFKSTNLPVIWNFNGTGTTQLFNMSSSNYVNTNFTEWTIASGAVVQLESDLVLPATSSSVDQFTCNGTLIFGTGSNDGTTSFNVEISTGSGDAGDKFTLASGGTLKITSADGILPSATQGNIRVGWNSNSRISLNTGGNYYYIGNAAQVTGTGLPSTVNNLGINNASGAVVSLSANVSVNGICYITNGSINLNSKVLSYGLSGSLCYNSNSVPQTCSDAEFPLSGGPVKLIIANSSTVTLHADRTLTASDTAISLRSGKLLLSGNDLTLSGTNVLIGGNVFDNTNMIIPGTGYLIRVFGSGNTNSFTYPIGAATKYTPVTLDFSAASSNMTIGARVVGSDYSQNTADNRISRYWMYKFSGATSYTYTATYAYANTGDIVGNEASIKLAYYLNTDWTEISGSSAGSYSLTSGTLTQATGPLTTGLVYTGRYNTLSTEPSRHPGTFTATGISSSTIQLIFSAASTINNAYGYLILRRQDGTFPDGSNINDGTAPSSLSLPAGTTLAANINSSSTSLYIDNGLATQQIYHYAIIPYNFENSTYNYRTTATIKTDSDTTLALSTAMSYSSCTTTQPAAFNKLVGQNTSENGIIRINVVVTGKDNPISVTSFSFNTTGSTNTADISNAKLYYVGTSTGTVVKNLDKIQFGSTVNNPNGSFTISDVGQILQTGTNYFILTYSISSTATLEHLVDAQCTSITVAGISSTPSATNPAGTRTIANSWGGGASGNTTSWSTASNWSSGSVPGNSGSAVISTGLTYYPVIAVTDTLKNLIIESGANITINSGKTLRVNGDLDCDGTINASNAEIALYGSTNQTLMGSGLNFTSLTVNKSPSTLVTMSENVTCSTGLTLISGTFSISDYTLIAGNIIVSSGILTGGSTSNISITGTTNLPEIINGINNLTLVSGTTTLTGNNRILGTLALNTNTLNLGNYTLSLSGTAPTKSSGGNIVATSGTIEFENTSSVTLPSAIFSGSSIKNMSLNGSGGVILSDQLTITESLALTNGILNANGKKITFSGNSISRSSGLLDLSDVSSEMEFANSSAINLPSGVFSGDVNKLTINTSGVGNLNLGSSITVSGALTLTNGQVSLGNSNLTLNGSLSGGSSSSYIATNSSGKLIRNSIDKGNSYVFPVGNGGYTPATIHFENQGTFSGSSISVHVSPNSEGIPGMNPVNTYRLNRCWTIESTGTLTGYSYAIDLSYMESDITGTGNESDLLPVKKSDNQWYKPVGSSFTDGTEQGTASVNTSGNVLGWAGLSSFSQFGGAGNGITPLPVELITFSGRINSDVISLEWSTLSETNSSHFILDKSPDAMVWEKLLSIPASGYSYVLKKYSVNDLEPNPDCNYYRLTQVDYDGKSKTYDHLVTLCTKEEDEFISYPNPGSNQFTLKNKGLKNSEAAQLTIYSNFGTMLYHKKIDEVNSLIEINTNLQPGIYYIELIHSQGKKQIWKHCIIEK